MSGVAVIRAKLAAYAPLTGTVPATRIKAGDLPLGTQLPAISVVDVDLITRKTVPMVAAGALHSERVQVNVHVHKQDDGYPALRSLLALVLAACPDTKGTVNGVACDSILPDTQGPSGEGIADYILQGSRDFIVKFTA